MNETVQVALRLSGLVAIALAEGDMHEAQLQAGKLDDLLRAEIVDGKRFDGE